MYMPDEYVFTGASMNSVISANSTISSKRRVISRFDRPSMMPLMKTFSRPEISGWNPAPSSMSADTRPFTFTVPIVGFVMPATSFSSVLLPDPFRPMTPSVCPRGTDSVTSFRAVNVSSGRRFRTRLRESSALLSVANCLRCEYRR
jgi:hypothetical protein